MWFQSKKIYDLVLLNLFDGVAFIEHFMGIIGPNLRPTIRTDVIDIINSTGVGVTVNSVQNGSLAQFNSFWNS